MMIEVDSIARRAWHHADRKLDLRGRLAQSLAMLAGRVVLDGLRARGFAPTEQETDALLEGDPYLVGLAAKLIEVVDGNPARVR
jgi:hypothetical protein